MRHRDPVRVAAAAQIDAKGRLDALDGSIVVVFELFGGQYFARDEVSAGVEKHLTGDASSGWQYPDVIRVLSTHFFDPHELHAQFGFLHIRKAIVPVAGG